MTTLVWYAIDLAFGIVDEADYCTEHTLRATNSAEPGNFALILSEIS
jgi:hypothetical protein